MLPQQSFDHILNSLGIPPRPDTFRDLLAAYESPERHYHNARHIADCLDALDQHRDLAEHFDEVALALWFHDAVYDARRSDNEEQSAAWARRFLESECICGETVARIVNLILCTKHDAPVERADEKLVVDIDLSILGQSAEVFTDYDAAIRREYHWVPWEKYRAGRIAVLRRFLDRPRIYATDRFFGMHEKPARENLRRSIATLLGNDDPLDRPLNAR